MQIDEARQILAEKLNAPETKIIWIDMLQDTDPAHYGIEDIEVSLTKNNIFVYMHEKTFEFFEVLVSFSARLGGSNDSNGFDKDCSVHLSGNGQFEYLAGSDLNITSIEINGSVNLYAEN